jgi:hypothetical protein
MSRPRSPLRAISPRRHPATPACDARRRRPDSAGASLGG